MATTLLLDRTTWDLVLDASNNIALADEPYSLAQDAASAIKTFLGECYWDTTVGIPYLTAVFTGVPPSVTALKQFFINAALTVPDVASATCFLVEASGRAITGQIQVASAAMGQTSSAEFSVTNPQGVG
jgi:hypothetical protein